RERDVRAVGEWVASRLRRSYSRLRFAECPWICLCESRPYRHTACGIQHRGVCLAREFGLWVGIRVGGTRVVASGQSEFNNIPALRRNRCVKSERESLIFCYREVEVMLVRWSPQRSDRQLSYA